jgi:hypothetical protein
MGVLLTVQARPIPDGIDAVPVTPLSHPTASSVLFQPARITDTSRWKPTTLVVGGNRHAE